MAAKYPSNDGNIFIQPTYAIDLIWHSHMQEPLKYAFDCLRLVGYLVIHNPQSMIEGEKLTESSNQVNKLWKTEFQCELKTDHIFCTPYY